MVTKRFTMKVLQECLAAAERDVDRYRAAWINARIGRLKARSNERALEWSSDVFYRTMVNLRAEADQRQHQLQAELDRNKYLTRRIYELETEITRIRGGAL